MTVNGGPGDDTMRGRSVSMDRTDGLGRLEARRHCNAGAVWSKRTKKPICAPALGEEITLRVPRQ